MRFNVHMNTTAKLIHELGGPAHVARLLGFSTAGGTQRVSNWIARNRIPLQVRVDHPDLFPLHPVSKIPLAGRSSASSPD